MLLGQTPDVLAFLSLVQTCWADHCDQMLTLRSIFLYLDRTYAMQASSKKSLWDMGLQIFRTHLSRRPEVARKAVQGLLQLIESERSGDQVSRTPPPRERPLPRPPAPATARPTAPATPP